MAVVLKHKYFCDKCTKSRYGDISFCSFDKQRDYTNHLSIAKHKRNCELIEKDENSILCKVCNEKFSVEGYEAHKKRNERLWTLKKYIGNKFLKCNRFQWDENSRLFSSMEELVNARNNNVVSSVTSKPKKLSLQERGLVNSFSYLKSNENKSIEEKEAEIEKELRDEETYSERPDLEVCECSGSKIYYFMENNEYSQVHLKKWNMVTCNCKYESD